MTEQEWLECTDLELMLQWASRATGKQTPGKDVSDRKLQLFACVCYRIFPRSHAYRSVSGRCLLQTVDETSQLPAGCLTG